MKNSDFSDLLYPYMEGKRALFIWLSENYLILVFPTREIRDNVYRDWVKQRMCFLLGPALDGIVKNSASLTFDQFVLSDYSEFERLAGVLPPREDSSKQTSFSTKRFHFSRFISPSEHNEKCIVLLCVSNKHNLCSLLNCIYRLANLNRCVSISLQLRFQ